MRNSPLSPDLFSFSPMLSILPVLGQVGKLETLTSFFFARYEKVSALRKELELHDPADESLRRSTLELAMLRQVLDWLKVNPEEK